MIRSFGDFPVTVIHSLEVDEVKVKGSGAAALMPLLS